LGIAYVQLNNINKTTRADFLHKFTENFFNSGCHKLLMLFYYGILTLETSSVKSGKEYIYFKTDKRNLPAYMIGGHVSLVENLEDFYTIHEIDLLLGYLEDIGNYEKENLLEIRMVYEVFGAYIEIAWENPEIQKYIEIERKQYGKDMYSGFEYIYNKIVKYQKRKMV
jgi:hypothetical protein